MSASLTYTGIATLDTCAQPLGFSEIDHGFTIITATSLQAKLLAQATIRRSLPHSQHLPDIMSLDQWLRLLHYRQLEPKRLLSRFHSRHIMAQIVDTHIENLPPSLSHHYAHLILQKMAEEHETHTADHFSTHEFSVCHDAFLAYLQEHSFITHDGLLAQAPLYAQLIDPHEKLVFSGFTSTTPALDRLWQTIPAPQLFRLTHHQQPAVSAHSYETTQDAFAALVAWCRHVLQEHPHSLNTVIVSHTTDSASLRDRLNTILCPDQALHYRSAPPPVSTMTRLVLADTPIFSALLSVLRFCHTPSLSHLIALAQTPYLCPLDTDIACSHAFVSALPPPSDTPLTSANWDDLAQQIRHESGDYTVPLTGILESIEKLQACSTNFSGHKTVSAWNDLLLDTLYQAGWPLTPLTTEESHILDKILQDLVHLASLPTTQESLDFSAWLYHFTHYFQQCSTAFFSERSRIVLTGWQDCVDIPSQHVYLYALDAEHWPSSTGIPTDLSHLQTWQSLQARMQRQTQTWTHSFARLDNQNQELLPSPLVARSQWHSPILPPSSHPYCLPHQLEAQPITQHGPVITPSEAIVSSTVLRHYNHCSSQGFIASRLGVAQPDKPLFGLPPWVLGQLVHTVLEKTIDSPTTVSPAPGVLDQTITDAITQHPACENLGDSMQLALQDFLHTRLDKWILHHNTAHADDSAMSVRHEVATKLQLGPVTVSLRADRVDSFANHHARIIDYKTGKVSKAGWFGARITEPQLPLYALSFPDVQAISFACLHPDQIGYTGVSASDNHPLGISPPSARSFPVADPSWETLLSHWQTSLTDTAQAYASGLLRKDPVHGSSTCAYCHFHNICRIHEDQELL